MLPATLRNRAALFVPLALLALALLALALLALALVTRAGTLGDGNYWDDEQLFFLIGQRLDHGAMLYVDVWDRKPPGLFALYALFAALGSSSLAYQIPALFCVVATALAVGAMAGWGARARLIAGGLYIVTLLLFDGRSGEAGVFCALPVAVAAWLAMGRIRGRHVTPIWLPMLLLGVATTIKQTAVFEGMWFYAALLLWSPSRPDWRARCADGLKMALAAAAPWLVIVALFVVLGHWGALWDTMIGANLRKAYNPGHDLGLRYGIVAGMVAPLIGMAVLGEVTGGASRPVPERVVIWGWLAAAAAGLAAVPNLIDHYMIPLIAPLAVLAAGYGARRGVGLAAALVFGLAVMAGARVDRIGAAGASNALLHDLAMRVRVGAPGGRVFVFDGPVALYNALGSVPPTPLVFPLHLSYAPERDVSPYPTHRELARVLAWRPEVVVVQQRPAAGSLIDATGAALVQAYVAKCHWHESRALQNAAGRYVVIVHGGCA